VGTVNGATTTVERCVSNGEALIDAGWSTTVVDESNLDRHKRAETTKTPRHGTKEEKTVQDVSSTCHTEVKIANVSKDERHGGLSQSQHDMIDS